MSVHVERVADLPGDAVVHIIADNADSILCLLASEFSERAADALRSFTRIDGGRTSPPGLLIAAAV